MKYSSYCKGLKNFKFKKHYRFTGIFSAYAISNYSGDAILLLRNIHVGRKASHVNLWIGVSKSLLQLGILNSGDKIEFNAIIKKHVSHKYDDIWFTINDISKAKVMDSSSYDPRLELESSKELKLLIYAKRNSSIYMKKRLAKEIVRLCVRHFKKLRMSSLQHLWLRNCVDTINDCLTAIMYRKWGWTNKLKHFVVIVQKDIQMAWQLQDNFDYMQSPMSDEDLANMISDASESDQNYLTLLNYSLIDITRICQLNGESTISYLIEQATF